jgi:hypothetical protein
MARNPSRVGFVNVQDSNSGWGEGEGVSEEKQRWSQGGTRRYAGGGLVLIMVMTLHRMGPAVTRVVD